MSNLSIDLSGQSPAPPRGAAERSWPKIVLRAAVGGSILVLLCLYFDFGEIVRHLETVDRALVLVACAILGMQYTLASLRWWMILRRLETPIRARQALAIFGLGALANLVLVTSIAGMSVRAFLLMHLGVSASAAAASLVVERLAAMVGLVLCVAIGLVFAFSLLAPHLQQIEASWTAGLFVLVGLGLVGLGFFAVKRYGWLRSFMRQIRDIFWSRGATVALTGLSLCIVVTGFLAVAALARGMNIDVNAFALTAVLPFVAFVSALPISIGGWGVREGSMVAGLGLLGVGAEEALALSIVYGLAGLLMTSSLGALSSLLWPQGSRVLAREKLAAHGELT